MNVRPAFFRRDARPRVGFALKRVALGVVLLATPLTAPACGSGAEEPESKARSGAGRSTLPKEIASIPVGPQPAALDIGFGSVWAASVPSHVARIDPRTNTVRTAIRAANDGILGVGEGAVWVTDYQGNVVRRIDPATNEVVATIAVDARPAEVAFTPGAVWVANHHGGSVTRIDPRTNAVVATMRVGPSGLSGSGGVAAGSGAVWVGDHNLNSVVRIDPATNDVVARIPLPEGVEACGGVAADERGVWISGGGCGARVARIDPATNTVAGVLWEHGPVEYGVEVGDPTVAEGSLWLVRRTSTSAFLHEFDRATARPVSTTTLRPGAGDIAFGFGSLWISDVERGRVVRVERSEP